LSFTTFPTDILALKMDKKLIKYHIAISQKLKVLKLSHFTCYFQHIQSRKMLPAFFRNRGSNKKRNNLGFSDKHPMCRYIIVSPAINITIEWSWVRIASNTRWILWQSHIPWSMQLHIWKKKYGLTNGTRQKCNLKVYKCLTKLSSIIWPTRLLNYFLRKCLGQCFSTFWTPRANPI